MTDGRVLVEIADDRRLIAEALRCVLARQVGIVVLEPGVEAPAGRTTVRVTGQSSSPSGTDRVVRLADAADLTDLVRRIRASALHVAPSRPEPAAPLTDRERSVLDRVREGESAREIARVLGISPRTVERHKQNIVLKLDVPSMSDALRVVADIRRAS